MTAEPTKRLLAITISAGRTKEDGQPEIGIQNVVGLVVGDVDVLEAGREHAHRVYPEAEGWTDYQVIWTEIEQGMMFGPLRLTWQVEDTSAGAGQ